MSVGTQQVRDADAVSVDCWRDPAEELAVLGDILGHPDQAQRYVDAGYTADLFADARFRHIWRVIEEYVSDGVTPDFQAIVRSLKARGAEDVSAGFVASIEFQPRQGAANILERRVHLDTLARCRDAYYLTQRFRAQIAQDPAHINNGLVGAHVAELEALSRGTGRTAGAGLTAMQADDVITLPAPDEIIEGVLWAGCVTVFVAESTAGKTFVALDQAAAVSAGASWHGRETTQGSCVHIGFEGDALGKRLKVLREVKGYDLANVYVIRASEPLSPSLHRDGETPSAGEKAATSALVNLRDELAATGRPPIRTITVDTIRASMTGSEDQSDGVSAYLRAIRRIMAVVPEAGCLLPHHSGWQDGDTQRKRERGSSAWRGNSDATLYLEAGDYDPSTGEAPLTLRTLKVRDGELPPPLHLIRRRVEVPGEIDRYGQPVTSCVIERDRRTREDREAERSQIAEALHRETDRAVLKAMRDHPTATSISRLRPFVGLRTEAVTASVARILQADWATEGQRGQPYTLTAAGLTILQDGHS